MMRATKTMYIEAAPDEVLQFLFDPSGPHHPGLTRMEVVHESPGVVGNSYAWTFKVLGVPRTGVMVVTEYVPGERLTMRDFGAMEATARWTVEAENGGTKATADVEAHLALPLVGRLLDPILRRQLKKNIAWGVRELEKAQPAPAAATAGDVI